MTSVCITGGTGFLGRHLVELLRNDAGTRVRVLTRGRGGAAFPDTVELIAGDLMRPESLETFVEPGAVVINLAYLGDRSSKDNIGAVKNLARLCKAAGASRIVHVSTAVVAGRVDDMVITEDSACRPHSEYERIKLAVECALVEELDETCPAVIVRPTAIFGEGGRNLLKTLNDLVSSGRLVNLIRLALYSHRRLNLVHVDNVVAAIWFLARQDGNGHGERYIVSDDEFEENNYTDVARIAAAELGLPPSRPTQMPFRFVVLAALLRLAGRSNINPRRIYSPDKLLARGFRKPVSFPLGLRRFLASYRIRTSLRGGKRPYRLLNVSHALNESGGVPERTFQMSRALANCGVDCEVLTLDLGLTRERLDALGTARVHALPCLSRRFYVPMVSRRKLNALVRDRDIIHLMGHWSIINALVYVFARRHGIPYVVCPAGALPAYGRSRTLKWIYNRVIGKRIIRNASALIAVTRDEFAHFSEYGAEPSRIVVIPNGINPESFPVGGGELFRRDHGLGEDPFVLFLGRLNAIKGPDLLLRAFGGVSGSVPRYHLVFAGPDDGMLVELKKMAQELQVADRVHFIGHVGGTLKSQAFHAADLLAIPSRSEAMSIVVLEAGITGTPVLATNQCGLNEIESIGGGRIVAASEEGIRRGLLDLLSEPAALGPMGARLEAFTRERFIWDTVVHGYTELFTRCLEKAH